jgi:hypothetical protein
MKLDRLHKLKSIHKATNISKLSPLTPIHNPKDKNPSTPFILLLSTNLLAKGMEIVRGERTSRIKHINPKSCLSQAQEIMVNLEKYEDTRYFTADEFREVKREFRIK